MLLGGVHCGGLLAAAARTGSLLLPLTAARSGARPPPWSPRAKEEADERLTIIALGCAFKHEAAEEGDAIFFLRQRRRRRRRRRSSRYDYSSSPLLVCGRSQAREGVCDDDDC